MLCGADFFAVSSFSCHHSYLYNQWVYDYVVYSSAVKEEVGYLDLLLKRAVCDIVASSGEFADYKQLNTPPLQVYRYPVLWLLNRCIDKLLALL